MRSYVFAKSIADAHEPEDRTAPIRMADDAPPQYTVAVQSHGSAVPVGGGRKRTKRQTGSQSRAETEPTMAPSAVMESEGTRISGTGSDHRRHGKSERRNRSDPDFLKI